MEPFDGVFIFLPPTRTFVKSPLFNQALPLPWGTSLIIFLDEKRERNNERKGKEILKEEEEKNIGRKKKEIIGEKRKKY